MPRDASQETYCRRRCDRRELMAWSAGAAAATMLRRSAGMADETSTAPLVDVHAYLGRWPFRRTADNSPDAAAAEIGRQGIAQAWAGTFEGLLHRDVSAANDRLHEACRCIGGGRLVPFGSVNCALPDWEEDVRRCHEAFGMPGVRLHPNYHGYTLADARFRRLLELAAARRLIVQLVVQLGNDAPAAVRRATPRVDLRPLAAAAESIADVRVTVHHGAESVDAPTRNALAAAKHVYFDAGGDSSADGLAALARALPAGRWVAGSGWPLSSADSWGTVASRLKLTDDGAALVRGGTARDLMIYASRGQGAAG